MGIPVLYTAMVPPQNGQCAALEAQILNHPTLAPLYFNFFCIIEIHKFCK